jgi:hypothetical protein
MEEIKGIARVKFHPGKVEEWKPDGRGRGDRADQGQPATQRLSHARLLQLPLASNAGPRPSIAKCEEDADDNCNKQRCNS